jgi:hypothetical protein
MPNDNIAVYLYLTGSDVAYGMVGAVEGYQRLKGTEQVLSSGNA